MTCIHAKDLIAASWEGRLSPADATDLQQHLAGCDECNAEMAALSPLWNRLGDIPAPEPARALRARFENTLQTFIAASQPEPKRGWSFARLWPAHPAWQGGIALAALAAGLLVGIAVPRHDTELAKLHQEIASTREMVALSLLGQQSATDRLQGVEYSGDSRRSAGNMTPRMVSALIQAIDHDPSVNVRLAAIDALGKASGSQGVLKALARSLPVQDSPMVQAALIDYFVDANDRTATGAILQLSQQPGINPAVLERSRSALQALSR